MRTAVLFAIPNELRRYSAAIVYRPAWCAPINCGKCFADVDWHNWTVHELEGEGDDIEIVGYVDDEYRAETLVPVTFAPSE